MLKSISDSDAKRPLSLAEQAYRRLRLEILTFGLLPSETVSEASLAQRFDLSIAPIRAALPRLRQEGLLINQHRRGQKVSPVTLESIEQTYELRYLLEPVAAEKAVSRLDAQTLRELDNKSSGSIQTDDRASDVEMMFANREFHVLIAEMSGNQLLARYVRELHDKNLRFAHLVLNSEVDHQLWKHSHEDIIAAFDSGDPQQSADAMREHVTKGREYTMQALLQSPAFRQLPLGGADSREAAS